MIRHPHRDQEARDALDDLGLIDDDNTEDMTAAPVLPGVGAPSGGRYGTRSPQGTSSTIRLPREVSHG